MTELTRPRHASVSHGRARQVHAAWLLPTQALRPPSVGLPRTNRLVPSSAVRDGPWTRWDGLFHAVTWLSVLIGLWLLYSRVTHSRGRVWASRMLWGWVLVGWGLFNLVEGIIDHHLLGIHHVRTGPGQTWWDIGFLVFGALLVLVGWLLQRGGRTRDVHTPDSASASPQR